MSVSREQALLQEARRRVCERLSSLLHPAIMRGDWDRGSLVKDELTKLHESKPNA